MPAREFPFTIQLSAGSSVNAASGILNGVTVAEVGIATGHFAFLDKDNRILGVGGADDASNFKMAARRVPLCMDEISLQTVIAAGQAAKRVKAREDHDDSVGARAGFVANFRMEDGKAVCDATIFDAYRNRGVFLETASETPELIGLSGDFKFTAEVRNDAAYMRVTKIDAVDIVDKGALTHAGLFRALEVDTSDKGNLETFTIMAKAPPAPPDLKAFKAMCDDIAAYRAAHAENTSAIDECMTALLPPKLVGNASPVAAPLAAAAASTPSSMTASEKTELTTELTATFATLLTTKLAEATAKITADANAAADAKLLEMRKQFSALGIKPTPAKEPTSEELAEAKKLADAETAKLAAGKGADDFFTLQASIVKERKVTKVQASNIIASERPEVFHAYRVKLGQIKAA